MGSGVLGRSEGKALGFSSTGLHGSPLLSLVVLVHLFVLVPPPADGVVLMFSQRRNLSA